MSNSFVEDGAFVNSIVGEGTRFNGELDLNGLLRIDGDFTGSIKTGGKVLIGKNGRAKCTISASTVVVGGAVRGDIYSSEKVIVLSSGIILGNIFTPRLIVEEGVILDGNCSISSSFGRKKDKAPENREGNNPQKTAEPAAGESRQPETRPLAGTGQIQNAYGDTAGTDNRHYENVSKNAV